jgi:hypothetical protein
MSTYVRGRFFTYRTRVLKALPVAQDKVLRAGVGGGDSSLGAAPKAGCRELKAGRKGGQENERFESGNLVSSAVSGELICEAKLLNFYVLFLPRVHVRVYFQIYSVSHET